MVDDCHADAEGVAKVHRWHRRQHVDEFPAHPDALCVVVADRVEEAVFLGEQAWRHAGVYDEGHESAEIRQRHGAAGGCKGVKGRRDVVVPADEAIQVSVCLAIVRE